MTAKPPERFMPAVTGVRYTAESGPKKRRTRGYQLEPRVMERKHDHDQMLADRLSGMSWEDIAVKHNVKGGASNAYNVCTYSTAARKLTPDQAKKLDDMGYRRVKSQKPAKRKPGVNIKVGQFFFRAGLNELQLWHQPCRCTEVRGSRVHFQAASTDSAEGGYGYCSDRSVGITANTLRQLEAMRGAVIAHHERVNEAERQSLAELNAFITGVQASPPTEPIQEQET